jgi:hypothetical protein
MKNTIYRRLSAGHASRGGTRERGSATTRLGHVPERGAGGETLRAQPGGVVLSPGWECSRGSPQGIGERGTTEGPRAGPPAGRRPLATGGQSLPA